MGFISSSSAGLRQTPGVARFKVLAFFFVVCDRVNLLILYEKIFIDICTCSLYFASLFAAVFLEAGKKSGLYRQGGNTIRSTAGYMMSGSLNSQPM